MVAMETYLGLSRLIWQLSTVIYVGWLGSLSFHSLISSSAVMTIACRPRLSITEAMGFSERVRWKDLSILVKAPVLSSCSWNALI
jgi:hypothetical protein